jgi:hypothetical protein
MSGSKPLAMWTGGQYRYRRFKTIDTTDMPNDQWVRFSNWVESYGPTVAGGTTLRAHTRGRMHHDMIKCVSDTVQHVDADRAPDHATPTMGGSA